MERWIKEYFDALFAAGLVYRYTPERYQALAHLAGKPYPSPTRLVKGYDGNEYVEEFIQPTVLPRSLTEPEVKKLLFIARAWKEFFLAQTKLVAQCPELLKLTGTVAEQNRGLEDPGYEFPLPFVRLDIIRFGDDFKVIDINTTRPAGLGGWHIINRITDLCPDSRQKLIDRRNWFSETTLEDTVAKVEANWQDKYSRPTRERQILTTAAGDWGNFAEIGNLLNAPLCPTETFMAKPDTTIVRGKIKELDPGFDQLAALYPDKACVLSPLFKRWCGNKLWFVLPKQEAYQPWFASNMGPAWQRGFWFEEWRKSLPTTGIVKSGTVKFANNNIPAEALPENTRWLLKTPAGSSAQGIRRSWWGRKSKWIKLLYDCRQGIVQEYGGEPETAVALDENGEPRERKLYAKYGLFLLNGNIGGMEIMYSPREIVHGGRDTYLTTARLPLPK